MKMHLAVGQRADQLAVLADVRDQHDGGMAADELRGVNLGWRPEFFREADLVLLAQVLVAQENDQVLVPDFPDLREGAVVELPAQIDADDFGADCRDNGSPGERQSPRRLGVQGQLVLVSIAIAPDCAAAAFPERIPRLVRRIMRPETGRPQGSLASTRTKAMRQGSRAAIDPGVVGALLDQHVAGLEMDFGIVEQHVDLARP